jgi:hypothetical protein
MESPTKKTRRVAVLFDVLWRRIFEWLHLSEWLRIQTVCRSWHALGEDMERRQTGLNVNLEDGFWLKWFTSCVEDTRLRKVEKWGTSLARLQLSAPPFVHVPPLPLVLRHWFTSRLVDFDCHRYNGDLRLHELPWQQATQLQSLRLGPQHRTEASRIHNWLIAMAQGLTRLEWPDGTRWLQSPYADKWTTTFRGLQRLILHHALPNVVGLLAAGSICPTLTSLHVSVSPDTKSNTAWLRICDEIATSHAELEDLTLSLDRQWMLSSRRHGRSRHLAGLLPDSWLEAWVYSMRHHAEPDTLNLWLLNLRGRKSMLNTLSSRKIGQQVPSRWIVGPQTFCGDDLAQTGPTDVLCPLIAKEVKALVDPTKPPWCTTAFKHLVRLRIELYCPALAATAWEHMKSWFPMQSLSTLREVIVYVHEFTSIPLVETLIATHCADLKVVWKVDVRDRVIWE